MKQGGVCLAYLHVPAHRVPADAATFAPLPARPIMTDVLVRNWGWVALRGGMALLFGLVTFAVAEIALPVLNALFGAFALAFGLVTLVAAAKRRDSPRWGRLLIGGILITHPFPLDPGG